LGKILIRKLAETARDNGISGLFAYTSPQNKAMIKLFNTLSYKTETNLENEMLVMSCRFDRPKQRTT
jgi:hypothetical protein